jgi:hypothetical protein
MEVIDNAVHSESSFVLKGEANVRRLASWLKHRPGSASQGIGFIIEEINNWVRAGNKILSPDQEELLVRPLIRDVDGYVYPVKLIEGVRRPDKGKVFFKERPSFLLEDHTMAFKEDGKRTVNRFFEKSEGAINQALDTRLWSMAFWLGVVHAIEQDRG